MMVSLMSLIYGQRLLMTCLILMKAFNVDATVIDTQYGKVQGLQREDSSGRDYEAYLGIPFAAPPLGELRWTKPRPPLPWDDILNATEYAAPCIQVISFANNTDIPEASEDCLYLNIYVPHGVDVIRENPLPVMVFAHGGAFIFGTGGHYPGDALALHGDVIVVNCNYRLSSIGFLSTENENSLGNYGLWDVVAVLEWVQNNIEHFGGDNNTVTLFGQSAGAAIVSHLAVSPHSKGLFHRAIAISGGGTGYYAFASPTQAARSARTLAELMLCPEDDSIEMVQCLRECDPEDLDFWGYAATIVWLGHLPNFLPVIDGDLIPDHPRTLWRNGSANHLDYINGNTFDDAASFILLSQGYTNETTNLAGDNDTLAEILDFVFSVYDDPSAAQEAIREQYPLLDELDEDIRTKTAVKAITDWLFGAVTSWEAEQHSKNGRPDSKQTYRYEFQYRQSFLRYPEWVNGSHSEDLYSIFGEEYFKRLQASRGLDDYSPTDANMNHDMMSYYTNFAHSGNPNSGPSDIPVLWPSFDPNDKEILRFAKMISVDKEDSDRQSRYDFWNGPFRDIIKPGGPKSPCCNSWQDNEDSIEELADMTAEVIMTMVKIHSPDISEDLEENINLKKTRAVKNLKHRMRQLKHFLQLPPSNALIYTDESSSLIIVQNDEMTYIDAIAACKNLLGPSAHLLWIKNANKDAAIGQIYDMIDPGVFYFIGLSDLEIENTFVWLGATGPDTIASYTKWNTLEPEPNGGTSENCGVLLGQPQEWHDVPCGWSAKSICELNF